MIRRCLSGDRDHPLITRSTYAWSIPARSNDSEKPARFIEHYPNTPLNNGRPMDLRKPTPSSEPKKRLGAFRVNPRRGQTQRLHHGTGLAPPTDVAPEDPRPSSAGSRLPTRNSGVKTPPGRTPHASVRARPI